MAGNEFGVGWHFLDRILNISDVAPHVSAAREVDIRKTAGEKCVAEMNHVRSGEVDDTVAVGVGWRHVNQLDLLTVEMDRERVIEGDDWKRRLRITRFAAKALPDIRVRNDVCLETEVGVSPGVIAVIMRVEHKFKFAGAQLLQDRLDFLRQRRELVVDDENTIRSDGHADVPAGSSEHVDVARDVNGFNFDRREILLRVCRHR